MEIKTKQELDQIVDYLKKQKYVPYQDHDRTIYLDSDYMHKAKIINMIDKANTLELSDIKIKKDDFVRALTRETDYTEIGKKIDNYFSAYNPNDKIYELINKFWLKATDSGTPPSFTNPRKNDIIAWCKFKAKWNLNDSIIVNGNPIKIYNLDSKSIRLYYSEDNLGGIKKLYKLIYNEESLDFDKTYGVFLNMGQIEIKIYQNGTAELRGNLTKLKDVYYKNIKDKTYAIIIYKGNRSEIRF